MTLVRRMKNEQKSAGAVPSADALPDFDIAILSKGVPLRREVVEFAGLGFSFTLQELTVADKMVWDARVEKNTVGDRTSFSGLGALMLVLSAVNPDGTKKFKVADEPKLAVLPAIVTDRVFTAGIALNRFGKKDIDEEIAEVKTEDGSAG